MGFWSRAFERLAEQEAPWVGALAVTLSAGGWSALCWTLAQAGHAPSRVFLPIARESYYRAQALFAVPLLLALWCICAVVAHQVALRRGGSGSLRGTANGLGVALAVPLLGLFLLPDLLVFAGAGFAALGKLVRITAPLSFFASVALATAAVQTAHHIPRRPALWAAFLGVLAQALLGSPLLR